MNPLGGRTSASRSEFRVSNKRKENVMTHAPPVVNRNQNKMR
jgi:hypothetical protein